MKARDVLQGIGNWWASIPGWHERIIWTTGGFLAGAYLYAKAFG